MLSFGLLHDYILNLQKLSAPLFNNGSNRITSILAVLVLATAWLITRPLYHRLSGPKLNQRLMANLIFPVVALFGLGISCLISRKVPELNTSLIFYFTTLTAIVAVIRGINAVISYTFALKSYVKKLNKLISIAVFFSALVTLTDSNSNIIYFLDNLTLELGKGGKISLWDFLHGCATVTIAFVSAMFLNRFSERKINQLEEIDSNLQQIFIRVSKIFIFVVAILITLPLIGIDMTVLSVFSGAIGVGIGLGLQKIASNFLSGFIILLDRSIKVGDRLIVDNNSGTVSKITTRYVVLERADGTDVLIPNEKFVTDSIQNQSYSNTNLRIELIFNLGSNTDIVKGMALIKEVMQTAPHSLAIEANVIISKLINGGVEVKGYFWVEKASSITDATNFVYLNVLEQFKQHAIQAPDSTQTIAIKRNATTPTT